MKPPKPAPPDDVQIELESRLHPFKVECGCCGSRSIRLDSDFGYSEPSGMWGSAYFECLKCRVKVSIWPG